MGNTNLFLESGPENSKRVALQWVGSNCAAWPRVLGGKQWPELWPNDLGQPCAVFVGVRTGCPHLCCCWPVSDRLLFASWLRFLSWGTPRSCHRYSRPTFCARKPAPEAVYRRCGLSLIANTTLLYAAATVVPLISNRTISYSTQN